MDLRKIGWEAVDWMHLTQDTDQWWALGNTVMNISESINLSDFLTS
jgi:hypothetical protein